MTPGCCPSCRQPPPAGTRVFIDLGASAVVIAGAQLPLTGKEAEILSVLWEASPAYVGRDRIVGKVWGGAEWPSRNAVSVHIAHLRSKLAGSGLIIESRRMGGYRAVLKELV